MTTKDVRPSLQRPTGEELKQLPAWLAAHVLGGLLPLWGSFLLLKLFSTDTELDDYVRHGEFALYAAAIAGSGLYLIFRELPAPFPYRTGLGIFSILILLSSAIIFAGVFVATRLADQPETLPPLNLGLLSAISIPLYLAALVSTVGATLLDMLRVSYDPRELPRMQMDELRNKVRSVEDNADGD